MADTTYHELFQQVLEERIAAYGTPNCRTFSTCFSFQQVLEERIAAYGDFWEIVALVSAYKGWDPDTRHDVFLGWIKSAAFTCSRCGTPFALKREEVREEWAVLCRRCVRS